GKCGGRDGAGVQYLCLSWRYPERDLCLRFSTVLSRAVKCRWNSANSHRAYDSNVRVPEIKPLFLRFVLLSSSLFLLLISARSLSSEPKNTPLTVTVTGPIKLTTTQGGGAVRSQVVLTNMGKAKLDWTASSNQEWLKFEPASGSVAPKATASIDVVADPTGFSPGIYVASAQIASLNAIIQQYDVTMTEESAFANDPIASAQRTFPPDPGMVNVKTRF